MMVSIFCLSASGELKKAAKIVSDSPVFFERESKIPFAAFYLSDTPYTNRNPQSRFGIQFFKKF